MPGYPPPLSPCPSVISSSTALSSSRPQGTTRIPSSTEPDCCCFLFSTPASWPPPQPCLRRRTQLVILLLLVSAAPVPSTTKLSSTGRHPSVARGRAWVHRHPAPVTCYPDRLPQRPETRWAPATPPSSQRRAELLLPSPTSERHSSTTSGVIFFPAVIVHSADLLPRH